MTTQQKIKHILKHTTGYAFHNQLIRQEAFYLYNELFYHNHQLHGLPKRKLLIDGCASCNKIIITALVELINQNG